MMYVPNRRDDRKEMLQQIGVSAVQDLFADIPEAIRLRRPVKIPGPLSEWELSRLLEGMAGENRPLGACLSFLGAGCYDHYTPAAVKHLIQRSEFYTAYTPYQPEVSQGTLQAVFEFQTYVARLTGMEVANASMYDGASALAEAVLMAKRVGRGRRRVILPQTVHPEYRRVVRTILEPLEPTFEEPEVTAAFEVDWDAVFAGLDSDTSCVILQNPNVFGTLEEFERLGELAARAREVGALFIVLVVEPLSLSVLAPPGSYGADIVVAEGQSLGLPMAFGGPHLGLFATRNALIRQMPGRLVGETIDARGNRGFVLTLATREQHIRRERATSNICTNQSLCALAVAIYLSLLGRKGLEAVGALNLKRAREAMAALEEIGGLEILQTRCFNEFVVKTSVPPAMLNERLAERGILGGLDLSRWDPGWEGLWMLCCTEKTTSEDIRRFAWEVREVMA
jgi:glycine dehydrogenase subunit 1